MLSSSGASGSLALPDGRVLDDGDMVFGINNAQEPRFSNFQRGKNYLFGVGLLPYVEVSGRLADYPNGIDGGLGVRDLSANVKLAMPKLFKWQPEIAVGITDLGGGAAHFRSRYLAVSDSFGPLRLSLGTSRGGDYLGKVFGSAELALGDTGAALLVERNDGAYQAGVRYTSAPIPMLANAQVVADVRRHFRATGVDGQAFEHTAAGFYLRVPFGTNARNPRRVAPQDEPLWTPPAARAAARGAVPDPMAPQWTPPPGFVAPATAQPSAPALAPALPELGGPAGLAPAAQAALQQLQRVLEKAGLERVRVGLRGRELVVEYENHRYNRNEVDAVGIVLGAAARLAPEGVEQLSVLTRKLGLGMYQTSVNRAAYHQFLRDGNDYVARSTLALRYGAGDGSGVQWLQEAGPRGWSRVRIDPYLVKFVGTEVGVFDYSLAANIHALVPLWKGAELDANYSVTVDESKNVRDGGVFYYAQQHNGLKSLSLSQAFWLGDRVLNVTSGGRLQYDLSGVQNETTWFLPYNDDQLRVQASRVRDWNIWHERIKRNTGSIAYMWRYRPLGVTAELAYNRYRGQDKGPSLQLSRWFGDVQAQAYLRSSNVERKIGFLLAFPLTPRQGMRPGWSHLEGPGSYTFRLETKLARGGECNCITSGVVEELPMVYGARNNLLNFDRVGADYSAQQLQRMREAALLYLEAGNN